MHWFRRSVIVLHRYLGIPLSFLFVLWFVTGIAMIYVGGMPTLSQQRRLAQLPELDLAAVRLRAADAAARAEWNGPASTTLVSVLGRPAYRFAAGATAVTVFADTGELLEDIDVDTARGVAADFLGAPLERVRFDRTVDEPDQWTLVMSRELPLYKLAVDDGAGTEVYVSPSTADVRLVTSTRTRTLAWLATIPHWFYITPLRTNQPLWYWTVVVSAGLGCVLALLGLVLGFTQFRKSTPFRLSASIPYRGWLRWHYLLGAVFGIFSLTWVFSGLLSMEPFGWSNSQGLALRRDALTGGPVQLERFPPLDALAWAALLDGRVLKEVELRRIQDEPYYLARYIAAAPAFDPKRERLHQPYYIDGRAEPANLLVAAATMQPRREPFSVSSLLERVRDAAPDASIVEHELLTEYDSYYYSRARQAPLPVLRVKFDDPERTWVYVDPEMSQVLATISRASRVERWLYNGLHSLDFGFWYDKRPLWDIGMIVLSLGALGASVLGLWLGLRRVRRDAVRIANAVRR
jgi:hypothetical protein